MKQKNIRRLAALAAVVLPVLFAVPAYAASAMLYLSPSSGTVINGNTLTVDVRENSGTEPVNAVQANMSYPASLLQFVGITSSSAFSVAAQNSGGSGTVQIGRGALPSVTGDQLVATVQFKALASSGAAAISFTGGSSVVSANTNANIMTSYPGGSFSLSAPAPAPTPSPTPAPAPSRPPSTVKSTPVPAPAVTPKDITPPTISKIVVDSITTGSATITWTTSEPASSEIDYGLTSGYGLTAVDDNLATSHLVVLNSPLIVPGTAYHFAIKNTDAAGNRAASSDQQFTTKGATVTLTIDDASGKPVQGALLSFDGQSGTTDAAGHATIANLPIGNIVGTVTVHGVQTVEVLRITGLNPAGTPQAVSFKLTAHAASASAWITGVMFALCLLVAVWIGYMLGSGRLPMLVAIFAYLLRRIFWKRAVGSPVQPVSLDARPTMVMPLTAARQDNQSPVEGAGGPDVHEQRPPFTR
ncbi:MAG TPA: cohesin domain-containing protein [Candidatus Saccharimonadales bacterium]|nr:cohesin domain-containing protein [Candidatus Saccharimonadales bacterium]